MNIDEGCIYERVTEANPRISGVVNAIQSGISRLGARVQGMQQISIFGPGSAINMGFGTVAACQHCLQLQW